MPLLDESLKDAGAKYIKNTGDNEDIPDMAARAAAAGLRSLALNRVEDMVFADDVATAAALLLRRCCPDQFTDQLYRYFTNSEHQQ